MLSDLIRKTDLTEQEKEKLFAYASEFITDERPIEGTDPHLFFFGITVAMNVLKQFKDESSLFFEFQRKGDQFMLKVVKGE